MNLICNRKGNMQIVLIKFDFQVIKIANYVIKICTKESKNIIYSRTKIGIFREKCTLKRGIYVPKTAPLLIPYQIH